MNVYITNLETKERLRLPMLPEEIKVKIGNIFGSYTILKKGEVKIPTGTGLDTVSWSGTFPGKHRQEEPYVTKWKSPRKCDRFMRNLWAHSGKPVMAKLLVTDTNINLNVYMQDYSPTESGGYGDISYSVTFIRAKQLVVKESAKAEVKKGGSSGSNKSGKTDSNGKTTVKKAPTAKEDKRTSPPASKTYTVKSGDSLWAIAQRYYGNGALYTKIASANQALINKHGGNPNLIYPGDVLAIP